MPSDTYILTISDAGVSVPSAGSVTNTSVAADAAIAFSKLASLTSGNVLVGNASNVPTSVAVTGDVTISNTGVTSIASGAIVNADINASAAIAHSKLASMSSGNILVGSSGNVPVSVAVTGDVTINSSGTTTIGSGAVTFAKMQTLSDYQIIGRNSGLGAGSPQSITCSSFAFSLLDDADASSARSTLGLGSMATQSSGSVSITGGTISNIAFGSGISFATPLVATSGGTGFGTYAIGDILYASTASTLAKLPDVATGNALISGGVNAAPLYGKIGLTTHVSGTLPVANGGTGVTAASTGSGGVVLSTSPTLVTPLLGTPTSGTLTNCTGLPLTTGVTGTLPVTSGGTGVTQSGFGELYVSTSAATAYTATNTWQKVAGTTTLVASENMDDANGTNNRLRYTGSDTRKFFITVCGTVTGANGDEIAASIFHSGTHIDSSITIVTVKGSGDRVQFSCQCLLDMATNEYVEVHTQNQSSTSSATFEELNICAHALI